MSRHSFHESTCVGGVSDADFTSHRKSLSLASRNRGQRPLPQALLSRHVIHALLTLVALATVALTTFALPCPARAEITVDYPPVSDNAALQYWQAFAMLPALTADEEKLLEECLTVPLDDATKALLDKSQPSLMFLRRAAKLPECDWGFDYRDGVSLYLPHLAKSRTLARIAVVDARRAFENGPSSVARDNAYGIMTMARQIGGDHTLISMLVSYSLENMTVDLVAPHVPKLGADYADAVAMFKTLLPRPGLEHAVACEKRMAATIVGQLREAESRQAGGWRAAWLAMASPEVPERLKNIESLEQVIKLLDEFQSTYDELGQLVMLPPAEFDAKYPEFARRVSAANPVAELLLPAMDKVSAAQRRTEVRMAMLLAGIAVAEGGPEKLADIKDPVSNGPFTYRELPGGFELLSKLQHEGKPVAVKFAP
jgi:hypothetical protein